MDRILQPFVDLLHDELGVSRCLIFRPDANGRMRICCISPATADKENLLTLPCDIFDYYQPLLSQGQAIALSQTDSILPLNLKKVAEKFQVRSCLIVPFVYQHSYLGGMCLHHCQYEHQWTETELSTAHNLARQCASTIYQTQQFDEISRQQHPNKILAQINRLLNSSLEPEQVLAKILKIVGEYFQVEQVIVAHFDEEQIQVCQEWRVNPQIPPLLPTQTPLGEWTELLDYKNQASSCQFCYAFKQAEVPELSNPILNATIEQWQSGSLLQIAIFIREKFFGNLILQTTRP
ncbi:MAG: GAF domain-containing protein, partial [Microcystaceae cyanobacterium]